MCNNCIPMQNYFHFAPQSSYCQRRRMIFLELGFFLLEIGTFLVWAKAGTEDLSSSFRSFCLFCQISSQKVCISSTSRKLMEMILGLIQTVFWILPWWKLWRVTEDSLGYREMDIPAWKEHQVVISIQCCCLSSWKSDWTDDLRKQFGKLIDWSFMRLRRDHLSSSLDNINLVLLKIPSKIDRKTSRPKLRHVILEFNWMVCVIYSNEKFESIKLNRIASHRA